MNIILLGPPGAGKGTQSKYLEDRFHLKQLSSGDMLRHAVAIGSDVGLKAKAYMEAGKLVPDDVVLGVVFEAIEALPPDLPGFILDGFPRTVQQAAELDDLVARRSNKAIGAVIVVDVSDDQLVKRISGRFTCANCGEVYNDFFRLPKAGVCERCGSTAFKRRSDDNAETVRERLQVYHDQTKPLIDYYRGKGKLHHIDGELPIDEVNRRINKIVEG